LPESAFVPGAPAQEIETIYAEARGLLDADSADAFARATTLVERAAAGGHTPAIAMLATFEAIGAGRPRDWRRAFDLLVKAAERGSGEARDQLRLLSGSTGDDDWSAMRGRIDLAGLLRAPRQEPLSDRPRLRALPGFASEAECRWIIGRADAKLTPASIWDEASGEAKVDPVRDNDALELRLAEMDVVTTVLRARISAAVRQPEPIFEVPQIMHYSPGQEFRPHFDALDPDHAGHRADLARRGQRMGTFLVYLNEDFEGGETEFPRADLSYRGRTGDALFFANVTPDGRPDPLSLHAGRSPVRGEKWILSQWIRDRAPDPAQGGSYARNAESATMRPCVRSAMPGLKGMSARLPSGRSISSRSPAPKFSTAATVPSGAPAASTQARPIRSA
jgi:hypothetical protein